MQSKRPMILMLACALAILASAGASFAEEEEEKPKGMQYDAAVGAVLTQVNYVDWAEGGEDALAYVLTFAGGLGEERDHDFWGIVGTLGFGQTKVGGQETRISANEVTLNGKYNYKLPKRWSAYVSGGFRSAIVTGYDYSKDPKLEKASFSDPGYYTLSVGAEKNFSDKPFELTSRAGLGLKYTTAQRHFRFGYADDPETPGLDKDKLETGIDSVTDLNAQISEDLLYVSKLSLFSTFEALDVWDVRWENTVTAKINKYVSTQLQLIFLFDKDVTGRLQRFQMLSIGLTYTIV
jgi:hypothetical protein